MVGAQALISSCLKIYVSLWKAFRLSSNQKLPSFPHPPNELVSAVVELSNLTSIASQVLTSERLTLGILYDSSSEPEFPKLDY